MPAAAARKPARKPPARKPAGKPAARGRQAATTRAARNARALERARNGHPTKGRAAPAAPRRKSGPAARPKPATRVAAPRVATRPLARAAQGGASAVLDGLLRGRGWVVLVGVLLAGIVFLNVSVLELNRGIARTDARATALERKNSTMRERVATLGSVQRIQRLAEMRGFLLPQPGDVTYVSPNRDRDARLAVTRMQPPAGTVETTTPVPVPEPAPVEDAAPVETATPAAEPAPVAPPPAASPEPVTAIAPPAAP
jgi:hypothetical protein